MATTFQRRRIYRAKRIPSARERTFVLSLRLLDTTPGERFKALFSDKLADIRGRGRLLDIPAVPAQRRRARASGNRLGDNTLNASPRPRTFETSETSDRELILRFRGIFRE